MSELSPSILGLWHILEMDGGEPKTQEISVRPSIRFNADGSGEFSFVRAQGILDHRLLHRDGKAGTEWTWRGNEGMSEVWGRGWAVLCPDRLLRGKFFIHQGRESEFVAKKARADKPAAFTNSPAFNATQRQAQYLAFIAYYAKLNGQAPAEADMQRYFGTTPPSVHQMVLMLEKRGFIERTPYTARSIRLLVPRDRLPELE